MPRLTRQRLVALLAALAALFAPLGATAAGSALAAVRQAVSGATQTTSQAPAGRIAAERELRDTAVRRAQHGVGTELDGVVPTGSERAGHGGPVHAPVGAPAAVALAAIAAWWVRRGHVDRAVAGRTTGIRSGRGPPAHACA
jgi:hypothetical protein